MSDYELIFFAGVAVFFAYKLWSAFGKTNGDEKARADATTAYAEKLRAAATASPKAEVEPSALKLVEKVEKEEEVPAQLREDVSKAKAIDPTFTLKKFSEGANSAFEMVVAAFAQKKRDVLQFLLSEEIYRNFDSEIARREAEGHEAGTTVVAIDSAEILDVEIKENICQIVVKFVSEQIHFIKDKAGEIIEGSRNQIDRVTDIWTFERNLTSKKPNWKVVGIQSA